MRYRRYRLMVAGLALAAFAALPALAVVEDTSEKLNISTYRVRSGPVTVLVDSYTASLRGKDSYIPLHIAVGLSGQKQRITMTPESFTLIDRTGRTYPVAPFTAVRDGYGKLQADRTLMRQRPLVVGEKFTTSQLVSTRFFPASGS